jgi:5-methylcytosine-specific restriction endonuclease McrA
MQSFRRAMPGGYARVEEILRSPAGRVLCRWCNLEVPKGRRTFCSDWCVNEWRLRSDPTYLRERVFERDRGVCAVCRVDTVAEWRRIRRLRGLPRVRLLDEWGLRNRQRKSLWDADHILPVVEGGGECDLDNIRTLCLKCHRKATADLRARRKAGAAADPGPNAGRSSRP